MLNNVIHCLLALASLTTSTAVAIEPAPVDSKESAERGPNIIFILCDDLGYGDLGVTWQNQRSATKKHRTPHLDQLAADGALLTRHYCPAPVCAPSRASLLSGLHQGHCNIRNNQFDKALADDHTLPSMLKSGGYRTALVGKYGLQGKGRSAETWAAYPTKRGFDDFFGYVRHRDGHVHYPANIWKLAAGERHQEKKQVWWNDREVSNSLDKCFTSDLFTAFAKKWIVDGTRDNPEQPFFLYLAYDTPHAALQLPTGPYPKGSGLNGGLQWTAAPGQMINTAKGTVDSYVHPDHQQQGWTVAEQRQAGMIRRIDDSVGDLMQLLRDLKIDQNTLVVFSSDNGPHNVSYMKDVEYRAEAFQAYAGLNGIKRDVLEGGIRTPTIVNWPQRIPKGKVDATPSQFHDWLTTFLAAAKLPAPAQADGVSLLPMLTGEGTQDTSTVYVEYAVSGKTPKYDDFDKAYRGAARKQMQVVVMDGYKGIRTAIKNAKQPFRIYDLANDERETNNLADSSDKFKQLQQRMQDRVLQVRRPNSSAKRAYDRLPIPAAVDQPVEPGLHRRYVAGEFAWVPRLDNQPIQAVDNAIFTAPKPGAVSLSGLIKIPSDGEFTFKLNGQQKAVLHLHDAMVIDADSPTGPQNAATNTVQLAKGLHPFRLEYLTDTTPVVMQVFQMPTPANGTTPVNGTVMQDISDQLFRATRDSK